MQFGFKHNHSTTHAIHKLLTDLNDQVDKTQFVAAALLDLEKAFDSVWLNGLYKLKKENFPNWLIFNIWDMISSKAFVTWDGTSSSTQTFIIEEGLQQGTVNSPILFNIYTSDILRLFGINNGDKTSAIAFADDIIVYTTDNKVSKVQTALENIVEKINLYYISWNLRLSPTKCETIVFRKPLIKYASKSKAGYKDFQIQTTIPGTNNKANIPHKKVVKYLGVQIDYLLRGNNYIDMQLDKAKRALQANGRIFFNKHLSSKTKIILYMLLVRPILTYAAPIWWNINNTTFEKLRVFERKCLRQCLKLYRSEHSEYLHYINNVNIYNLADIPRIDCFTIKLTRDYFSSLSAINNAVIRSIMDQADLVSALQLRTGYTSPQAFMYCDARGLIQNENNTPILYHWRRNKADKRISLSENDLDLNSKNFTDSKTIPCRELNDFHRLNFNIYWWLNINSAHMLALSQQKRLLRNVSASDR